MAWPTDDLTKTHMDAGTDDPSQARVELVSLLDKVKAIIAGVASAATASCVVIRDAAGDFAARYITAAKFIGPVNSSNGTQVLDNGVTGSDAAFTGSVKGVIKAANGTVVLDNGTDGTDAVFHGSVDGGVSGGADTADIAFNAYDLPNRSFANSLTGWTLSEYSGGTVALDSAAPQVGSNSLKFVSTGAGAGSAKSPFYTLGNSSNSLSLTWIMQLSSASMTATASVYWYDKDLQPLLGADEFTEVFSASAYNRTTVQTLNAQATLPSGAKYAKFKLDIPGAAGTAYLYCAELDHPNADPVIDPAFSLYGTRSTGPVTNWTADTDYTVLPYGNRSVVLNFHYSATLVYGGGATLRVTVNGIASADSPTLNEGANSGNLSVSLTSAQLGTGYVTVRLQFTMPNGITVSATITPA